MSENSSSLLNSTAPPCVDLGALQRPLAVLYSVIFVLGLLGNVTALGVFLCVRAKKTSVRVFLINVALADLLLVACLPFRVYYHSRGNVWTLQRPLCRVVGNLFYMNMYISITLLGLLSVDRYVKIYGGVAMRRRLRCTRWSSALCCLVWILAFIVALVLVTSSKSDPAQSNRCFHYRQLQQDQWKAYINMAVLLLFWLVFVSMAASYGRIAARLLRASRDKPALPNAARYARTARKSFVILALFTVCFAPYHVVRIFYIATQLSDTPCSWRGVADRANEAALLLSSLNSCLDPVMYFLLSSSLRQEVTRLLRRILRRPDAGGTASANSSTAEFDGRSWRRSHIGSREKTSFESNLTGT